MFCLELVRLIRTLSKVEVNERRLTHFWRRYRWVRKLRRTWMQRYRLEMKPHPLCWLSPSAAVNEAPPGQYSGRRSLQIRKSQGGLFTEAVGCIKNKTKKLYESEWPTLLRLLASQRRLAHLRGEEGGGNLAAASYPPYGHVSKCQLSPRQRWRRSCPSWATPSKVCRRCPCGSSTTGNTRGPSSACGSASWRKVSRLG